VKYRKCRGELAQLLLQPIEIDRLGDELGSARFAGAAAAFVVAVGGDDHRREIGETAPDFAVEVVNYPDGWFAVQFNGTALGFKVFDKIQTVQPARSSTTSSWRPCWSK
jgi:hypothetical protein